LVIRGVVGPDKKRQVPIPEEIELADIILVMGVPIDVRQ
jgi:hypothetical protein